MTIIEDRLDIINTLHLAHGSHSSLDAGVMAREHGTTRGYRDHLLGGEDPCERCKAANTRYQREYRLELAERNRDVA